MLRISEIYETILGESLDAGRPCVIVRLTGCHRRCDWCDTEHAFHGGEEMDVAQAVARATAPGHAVVLVTGGEPLLQRDATALMAGLLAAGRRVVLETSGTLGARPLDEVPPGVRRVVDLKAPSSGIPEDQVDWSGLRGLGPDDEVKVVCADRRDYEWARDLLRGGERLPLGTPVSFSPVHGRLAPADLAAWILADRLDARLQVQLHKVIWPGRDRGV